MSFDPSQYSKKEIGRMIKNEAKESAANAERGSMGAATLAVFCLGGAYLMPFIGSYFVFAAVVFAGISWLLSR